MGFNTAIKGLTCTVIKTVILWNVSGSNPGRGEIFRTCPDGSWVPPSLLYNGYRVFPGG